MKPLLPRDRPPPSAYSPSAYPLYSEPVPMSLPFHERTNSSLAQPPPPLKVRASDRLQYVPPPHLDRKRLDKLLRSAKTYRTKAGGAIQTRSPLDGRPYSRHVLIEGARSTSRSKSRRAIASVTSRSPHQHQHHQQHFIKVSSNSSSRCEPPSGLMFLSSGTPEHFETAAVSHKLASARSPDFPRAHDFPTSDAFHQLQRQMLSPSETPKPRREVPAPHCDVVFENLHTNEEKELLNDTFDRPEGGAASHASSIRSFSEDAEFIDFLKNIVLFCSGEAPADESLLTATHPHHDKN